MWTHHYVDIVLPDYTRLVFFFSQLSTLNDLQKSFAGNMRSIVVSDNHTNWARQRILAAGIVEICTRNNVSSSFCRGGVGFISFLSFCLQHVTSYFILKCFFFPQ